MANVEIQLALHGAVILLLSLLSGGFFSHAINNKEREVAWRVVHSGGSMAGIMLIALSSIVRLTALSAWSLEVFAWLAIAGTWALVLGMLVAAFTGARGLRFGTSKIGSAVYAAYVSGSVLSLLSVALLIFGLVGSLR